MKYIGWDRKLWGVISNIHESERHLLGESWDKSPEDSSKPTRPLLFATRRLAAEWCKRENDFYKQYSNACSTWRFSPIRVQESVTPVAKCQVEK